MTDPYSTGFCMSTLLLLSDHSPRITKHIWHGCAGCTVSVAWGTPAGRSAGVFAPPSVRAHSAAAAPPHANTSMDLTCTPVRPLTHSCTSSVPMIHCTQIAAVCSQTQHNRIRIERARMRAHRCTHTDAHLNFPQQPRERLVDFLGESDVIRIPVYPDTAARGELCEG